MSTALNQENKRLVWDFWQAIDSANGDRLEPVVRNYLATDVTWNGFDPINRLRGVEAFVSEFWLPLHRSFPDLERRSHLFFGGRSNGRVDGLRDGHLWVCGTGYLHGTFANDYLAIPATARPSRHPLGRVLPLGARQNRRDLLPPRSDRPHAASRASRAASLPPGKSVCFPPPRARDGILSDAQERSETRKSLDHIRQFIFNGLNRYDESDLESMGMADFFHPDVRWYGPGGIGACLSHQDFRGPASGTLVARVLKPSGSESRRAVCRGLLHRSFRLERRHGDAHGPSIWAALQPARV